MNLSPEIVIVSGDKFTLIMRPVFGEYYKVRVTNHGIELPKDIWEKIFEGTIRGETAKAVAIEGSGLGLYISRKLIEIQDGIIKVESCEQTVPTDDGTLRWKTTFLISLKC